MSVRVISGIFFCGAIAAGILCGGGCGSSDEGPTLEEASKPMASANPDVPTPPPEQMKMDDPKTMKRSRGQ